MNRRHISFIKFILEAYDNVAVVSTVEPRQAIVQVVIAPGCDAMVDDIMAGFAAEFTICRVADGLGTGS